MLTQYASNRLPCDDNDEEYVFPTTSGLFPDGSNTFTEGWYILMTGCQPNTIVAKVDVYLVGEFFPTLAASTSVVDKANRGIATTECIANLVN